MIGKAELLLLGGFLVACGTDNPAPNYTYNFGPFDLPANHEDTDLCVAVTLHNTEPIFVNAIDMVGATGIHHSNWVWVPAGNATFAGFPEGQFACSKGDGQGHPYDQEAAAFFGGVLFAQSTQATSDTQEFPPGAAIRIPANARIVASIHLVNASDNPETVPLSLTLHPIAQQEVTTLLNALAIENLAIALPPHEMSRFTVECDMSKNPGQIPWQFNFYHALAHYHKLGVGLTLDAIRDSDGGADTIWSTEQHIGDELGGMLSPAFAMAGHSKIRLSCTFDNTTDNVITWGNAGGEMCIAFAYTDSPYVWTAGLVSESDNPGTGMIVNGIDEFTAPACSAVVAKEGN
jgi:hypothetical protein